MNLKRSRCEYKPSNAFIVDPNDPDGRATLPRRQERVWRAQRPLAKLGKIDAIATSSGVRDRTPRI